MLLHSISIHEINLMKLKIRTKEKTEQKPKKKRKKTRKKKQHKENVGAVWIVFHWCDVEPEWGGNLINQCIQIH